MHSWCGTRLRAGRCWRLKLCTVPAPCVGRPWLGVVVVSRGLDHCWNQDAPSRGPASWPLPLPGASHRAFPLPPTPQAHQGFSSSLSPSSERRPMELLLWCLLPAWVGLLTVSYSYGGQGGNPGFLWLTYRWLVSGLQLIQLTLFQI